MQFIAPSIGKLMAFDQRFQIGDMPFLFADNAAETRFWEGEDGRALLESLGPQGIIGLTTWPNGMRQIMNSERPVRTPADTRGLKIRIPSGGVLVDTLQAFGAGASVIPFTDTYSALQQGVVDGTLATFDNIENEKYAEVLEYLTVANVNSFVRGADQSAILGRTSAGLPLGRFRGDGGGDDAGAQAGLGARRGGDGLPQ